MNPAQSWWPVTPSTTDTTNGNCPALARSHVCKDVVVVVADGAVETSLVDVSIVLVTSNVLEDVHSTVVVAAGPPVDCIQLV